MSFEGFIGETLTEILKIYIHKDSVVVGISSLIKMDKILKMGTKQCGKRRNCSLRAISPFPAVFPDDLYCRHVKNQGLFGKGLRVNQNTWKYKLLAMDLHSIFLRRNNTILRL